jgi:hypothetical protein
MSNATDAIDVESILAQAAEEANDELDNLDEDSGSANPDNPPADSSEAELEGDSDQDGGEAEPGPDAEGDTPDNGPDDVAEVEGWFSAVNKWQETKNPDDLKGTPFEWYMNQAWGQANRRIEEAANAKRRYEEQLAELATQAGAQEQKQPETRQDDAPPEIDYTGTEAEIKAATERRLEWERAQVMSMVQEQIDPVQKRLAEVRQRQMYEQVHSDLTATPGYSEEVNKELGVLYAEVNPKNEAGHWFNRMILDGAGRVELVRMAQERIDKAAAPDKEDVAARLKKATEARDRSVQRSKAPGGKSETEPPELRNCTYDGVESAVLAEISRQGLRRAD